MDKNKGLYSFLSKQTLNAEMANKIEKDVFRTFPEFPFFARAATGPQKLRRILTTFALFCTDIGYVQGMNFLVGGLLLSGLSEEEAFWCLVQLFKVYSFDEIYSVGLTGLKVHFTVLTKLISVYLPQLYEHFEKFDITPNIFATRWLLTLFVTSFEEKVEVAFWLWDYFFVNKWIAIWSFALSLLKFLESKLLRLGFEDALLVLCKLNFKEVIKENEKEKEKAETEKENQEKTKVENEVFRQLFEGCMHFMKQIENDKHKLDLPVSLI